jgi:Zn-finger nucleic acid-binding protein
MDCPRCETSSLSITKYESVEIDKCSSCNGIWLDDEEILDIVADRTEKFTKESIQDTIKTSFSGVSDAERANILHCPKCKVAMTATNYVMQSGIIIDRCPQGHGLWFDEGELEKVQEYREHWQDQKLTDNKDLQNLAKSVRPKKPREFNKLDASASFADFIVELFTVKR